MTDQRERLKRWGQSGDPLFSMRPTFDGFWTPYTIAYEIVGDLQEQLEMVRLKHGELLTALCQIECLPSELAGDALAIARRAIKTSDVKPELMV